VRKGADKIRGKPSPLKGSKMNLTDEQRKNRSEKQKARPKLFGADNHNYGKKWSAEAKQKMSEYKRNNTSNETRAKISASRKAAIAEGKIISWNKGTKGLTKGNPKIWEVTDPLGTVYIVTNGLKNFCKNHPISYDSLKEVSTGKKEHVKGWKAKEIIDNNSK
jgi:hypothetical protein